MKRIDDFLVNTPSALVVLGAAAILLICAVIPPLHGIAWVLVIVAVVAVGFAVLRWWRTWAHLQGRIDALQSQAAEAYAEYAPVTLSTTPQEELAVADRTAARTISDLFPEDEGLVRRLRIDTEMTEFPAVVLAPLTAFLTDFAHGRFDDPAAHRAFMDLYRSARSLQDWIRRETEQAAATESEEPARVLVPGDRRDGGWKEFSDAKAAGEQTGDRFLAARTEFARVMLVSEILEG